MNKYFPFLIALTLACASLVNAQENDGDHQHNDNTAKNMASDGHEGHENDEHGNGDSEESHDDDNHEKLDTDIELSDEQRRIAGIKTMILKPRVMGEAITAPGEVTTNAYRTSKVTPRIAAQIISRHTKLGDHVRKGQLLVALSSVEMAEAQGVLLEAETELRRVEKLGNKIVSEQRIIAAQIAYQQAIAKVRAYGMTASQIDQLIKQGNRASALGEFGLFSYQDGTVITDDFVLGEIVEPGRIMLEISDESLLWVESRLSVDDASRVAIGANARIKIGETWLPGKVSQARHTLDEITRTLAVHVEVANPDDSLHPGQFVTVVIEGKNRQQGLVVPLTAVLRSPDGDWQVFVESAPGRFEPKEVEVIRTVGDEMLIKGIEEGKVIVSEGAFFVQSEIAKGGFEVHNH